MPKAATPSFYFVMSLIVAGIVVYGFSYTVGENLIHPPYPRPWILYFHAAIFSIWVCLFIFQTALVRVRRVTLHRSIGRWLAVVGFVIPILGVATALAMASLHARHGDPDAAGSLPISCFDMVAFTTCFVLAIRWRTRPEFHRRLMFMATCALTAAAFGRIPALDHADWFYVGVDSLIAIVAVRDFIVDRQVHPVLAFGLPSMIVGQIAVASFRWSNWWVTFAHNLY
jgi:hypothetical protein